MFVESVTLRFTVLLMAHFAVPFTAAGRALQRATALLSSPSPAPRSHSPARFAAAVGKLIGRAALRLAHLGDRGPMSPVGYVLLLVTVAAMLLVAMLSTSPLSNELGHSPRLSWWFS